MWDDVRKAAMVGTDRVTLVTGAGSPQLDALVRALGAADPTTAVLGTAGTLAVRDMAGYQVQPNATPLPGDAPADERQVCSPAAAGLLRAALADKDHRLTVLWVETCAAAGQRPPDGLLPALMLYAHVNADLWGMVGALVGERGAWLAREFDARSDGQVVLRRLTGEFGEPEWRAAVGTGMMAVTFRAYRYWHPAAARDALETVLREYRPRVNDRHALVDALAVNLSADDEPLLEKLLNDLSKRVPELAADLLARLPGSAYVGRMRALAEGMVTPDASAVTPDGVPALQLRAHTTLTDAMKRDQLDRRGHVYGLNPQQVWMYNIVRALPLSYWEETLGLPPAEVVALILASHNANSPNNYLAAGVEAALRHHATPEWAAAWLTSVIAGKCAYPQLDETIHTLARLVGGAWCEEQVSAWLAGCLRERDPDQVLRVSARLALVPGAWSAAFSREVVGFIEACMHDAKLRGQVVISPVVGDYLHPAVVDEAYTRITAEAEKHRILYHLIQSMDIVLTTVKRRQAVVEAFTK